MKKKRTMKKKDLVFLIPVVFPLIGGVVIMLGELFPSVPYLTNIGMSVPFAAVIPVMQLFNRKYELGITPIQYFYAILTTIFWYCVIAAFFIWVW